MFPSTTKRFSLPFSNQKSNSPEAEAAAVFAIAELERHKSGGLLTRQQEEKLVFLTKSGYPLWLFPKNDIIFVFDGFAEFSFNFSYDEIPPVKAFIESLEANSTPREKYTTFLSDHTNYFQQSVKERLFMFRGLIVDLNFKNEFNIYRKEPSEGNMQTNAAFPSPTLEETAIASMVSEFDNLRSKIREEADKLPECIRHINKTTSQYITEIDYEVAATKEEADAKIKAQEELVNPQIAKLTKDYNRKIKELAESFDKERASLEKLIAKTQKTIESNEGEIRFYQRKVKVQALEKHAIYEKRWKQKIKQIKKELKCLKKEHKKFEDNLKKISKQKAQEISETNFKLDTEIKTARQPIVDLEVAREAKIVSLKLETEKILEEGKTVIESLNKSINLSEATKANFSGLGLRDQDIKNPSLFFIPFYVACYEMGLKRRYLFVPPSDITAVDFSAKLKGALGMSKLKDLFKPHYKTIATLIRIAQGLTKQNSLFENQLYESGQRNNFLKNRAFTESAQKGLIILKHQGWLSDKEQQVLSNRLAA